MHKLLLIVFLFVGLNSYSQSRIDGSFPFQTDPNKKYSLYIPSTYSFGTPNNLMIGFHPFNTSRWDAVSWCDTLLNFAEANGLILACPDGGLDGQVDHPIDTAFTSALIDSVKAWYNIDADKMYAMGFSVGGRATYTYGMFHYKNFGGFIPIGAAINGTNEVNSIIQNSSGLPYYLVHGANDSPSLRYTPILNALIANNAIVNSILMPGVGHTIDFANRNQILSTAYQWVDSVNCASLSTAIAANDFDTGSITFYPTVLQQGESLNVSISAESVQELILDLYDTKGQLIFRAHSAKINSPGIIPFELPVLKSGIYILTATNQQIRLSQKIVIE